MRAIREAGEHLRSLLVYSVLTASTIGPGTVAMCAKSGSEYDTALLWCVLVAAAVAWAMQEGSARLTLASNRTLGQCLRALTATRPGLRVVRHLLLAFILVGSFAYTCNNFAGTMAAVDMVVGSAAARTAINFSLAPACVALLLKGNVRQI
jgi:manganese transport protein